MSSQAVSPTMSDNDATVGFADWLGSTGDVESDDGAERSVSLTDGVQSKYLLCLGTAFSIPSGATIDGIEVRVLRRVDNAGGGMYAYVSDYAVRLYYGSAFVGADKASGASWPVTESEETYGGPTDLWGLSPTVSGVNDSSFGVAVSAQATGGILAATAYIDWIAIEIYYSVAVTDDEAQDQRLGRSRRASKRITVASIADLEDDPDPVGDQEDAPSLSIVRSRRKPHGQTRVLWDLTQAASVAIELDDAYDVTLTRGRRQRPRLTTVTIGDVSTAAATCDCPPGGAEIVSEGYAVEIVAGDPTSIETWQYAAEVVSAGWGGVEIDPSCDC